MASQAAAKLREAMKGFGTDESAITKVVANLDVNQIKAVVDAYTKEIGRDLLKDIKDETGGHYEDALVALLTPIYAYDAQLLRKAMKGIGTDEDILCEVICSRDPKELKLIAEEFKRQFAHDLEEDIRDETGGDLKRLLVHRLKAAQDEKGDIDSDVELLYKAGQGKIGTDEAVFFNILAHRSKDYIQKLNTAYANKHNKSLHAVVESELGGDLKKGILALVTPPAQYFADKIHHACKGAGTDDATVIRVVASQRGPGRYLKEIAAFYLMKHDVPLKKRISDECSGDYKKLLVGVIEHYVEGKQV